MQTSVELTGKATEIDKVVERIRSQHTLREFWTDTTGGGRGNATVTIRGRLAYDPARFSDLVRSACVAARVDCKIRTNGRTLLQVPG